MNKRNTFITILLFISGLFFSHLLVGNLFANTQLPTIAQYGPIKSGDSLWQIAAKTRIKGMSRLKMMRFLHKNNPHAFIKGDINRIKKGTYLRLPSQAVAPRNTIKSTPTPPIPIANRPIAHRQTFNSINPPQSYDMLARLQKELLIVTNELKLTKNTLNGLQAENVRLKTNRTQEQTKFSQRIATINNTQLTKEQALINENKRINNAYKELVSDISTLKEQVIELEVLQKMKDAHIVELKKALNHSSTVIKEQTAINLQIHQRMNVLESKLAGVANNTNTPSFQVLGISAQNNMPINESTISLAKANNIPSTSLTHINTSRLSKMLEEDNTIITGKFWLILVMALLLFTLAFFWRSFSTYGH